MLEAIRSKSEAGLTPESIGAERGALKFATGRIRPVADPASLETLFSTVIIERQSPVAAGRLLTMRD